MFVAASSRSFSNLPFEDVCNLVADLEFDKIELWLNESGDGLRPSVIAADPDKQFASYREITRLTPVALYLEHDIDPDTFAGICKWAKMLRIAQITLPASPLGTPFNTEIDRLKRFLMIANSDGVRISIKTQTGMLTEDPRTAVELCQSVNGVGLTFDPSYYIQQGYGQDSFDPMYPYVFHTHLRDSTATELQVSVGLGNVDYNRIINQLRREKYGRVLSVDLLPDHTAQTQLQLEMRKLRMLLETLL